MKERITLQIARYLLIINTISIRFVNESLDAIHVYDHYLCSQTRQMAALKQNLLVRIQGLQIQNDQLQSQNDQLQTQLRRGGGDEKQKLIETVHTPHLLIIYVALMCVSVIAGEIAARGEAKGLHCQG